MRRLIRTATASACAPFMRATGFRFNKEYRWGQTRWHRTVYACVDTIGANMRADGFYNGGLR
jgi:hypothetical protein